MAKTKIEKTVKDHAEELLKLLTLEGTVEVVIKEEDTYQVNIATGESNLLIGYHGEALSSFQLILGLIVYKKLGSWIRIVVEVGDYRARREEQLKAMALSYATQAVNTGQVIYLPYLHPAERRIIHLALEDSPRVECFSEGEGRNRRVIIKPK
ncbi:MAG: R3H domain-containing nucleic acid-binding protein [Patescibacteria group bacterium]